MNEEIEMYKYIIDSNEEFPDINEFEIDDAISFLEDCFKENQQRLKKKREQLKELKGFYEHKKRQSELQKEMESMKKNEKKSEPQVDIIETNERIYTVDIKYYIMLINDCITKNNGELDMEEICSLLPSRNLANFNTLMNSIIIYFQKQLSDYTIFYLNCVESFDEKDLINLSDDIKKQQELIDLCIEYRNDTYIDLDEEIPPSKKGQIIFLHSNSDVSLFENDIKGFTQEYFEPIEILLHDFEDCSLRHSKQIGNSHNTLKGYNELRNLFSYIRILYDKLGNNTYVVLGLVSKKCMYTKKISDFFISRIEEYERQGGKKAILDKLNGPDKEIFMQQQEDDLMRIKSKLGRGNCNEGRDNQKVKTLH